MKTHNCPYKNGRNQRKGRCTPRSAPDDCPYEDPKNCSHLCESKAWTGLWRFFKRKSKIEPEPTPNLTISAGGSA